ncbi:hypothetical protein P3X46_003838 [Hevea brasiliensis]|uniref:EF-hand domain-containing protein n=1 Tax=Hevea brasiliensis TaxID=3981 RepID=A0ABQ9N7H3_HEVBR|nr:uncharacterized protein LOC110663028 isoform X1 [Hevea brasiliensis]KAJ9188482.1 hypothetical protein P3X46_003838 [Hevea brasiliensis]
MAKQDASDSELESEKLSETEEENEEEGEEEVEPGTPTRNVAKQGISEYEKQRLSRIAENKARMEALGLHKMASSLLGSNQKSNQLRKSIQRKGKSKVADDDDDYRPNDDDAAEDKDDDDSGGDEDDEDFVHSRSSSKSRRNKVKNKCSKPKKKVTIQKHFSSTDYIDEENDELTKAIALSLQDSAEDATLKERKRDANIKEGARRKNRKKSQFNNRVQMTEDELVLHFFQFDEAGRGLLTVRDLQRVATAHDFTWTDWELTDMIHCFDSDGDGKLNLDDFRKIVCRCNMIRGSENY